MKDRDREEILLSLPTPALQMTCQQSIQMVRELKASPLARMANPAMQGVVEGILSLLTDLNKGISPSNKTAAAFLDFYKLVLKRTENFFRLSLPAIEDADPSSRQLVALHGRSAFLRQYSEPGKMVKRGRGIRVQDLQALKTYSWVLAKDQKGELQNWLSKAIAGEVAGSHSPASVSSPACRGILQMSAFSPLCGPGSQRQGDGDSQGPPSASESNVNLKHAEHRANILKFFAPQGS